MKLTLQGPKSFQGDGTAEEKDPFPNVTMWFSGNRKIAAAEKPKGVLWLDRAANEQFAFDRESKTMYLGPIDSDGRSFVTLVSHLLQYLKSPNMTNHSMRVVSESRKKVTDDGVSLEEFTFEFAGPAKSRTGFEIRVDSKTHRPVQLTMTQHFDDKAIGPPATFAIDYPDSGPNDIFALGVPKNSAMFDLRAIEKFYEPRETPDPADYEATVFATWTGEHFLKNAREVKRHRHNAAGTMIEQADFQKWMEVLDLHGSKKQTVEWWVDEISRAKMVPFAPNTRKALLHERLWFGRRATVKDGMKFIEYPHGKPTDLSAFMPRAKLKGFVARLNFAGRSEVFG
jgi:hypothetical protein